jgi:predicted O-methyltransferase YrrM
MTANLQQPKRALDRLALRSTRPLLKLTVLRRYRVRNLRHALAYLLRDREITNFTYDLENVDELADFLTAATGRPREAVDGYLGELSKDRELTDRLTAKLRRRRDRNPKPKFGRRAGWYGLVRIFKPSIVVETGTHDGLGTAVLLRALERNLAEGKSGRLLSFDVDPSSGWLVADADPDLLELHVGDTARTLEPVLDGRAVGLFVHDSLHTYEHETFELETAVRHADEQLVLISDNAHSSDALPDLCGRIGIQYYHFNEQPRDHFYPGAAIGLAIYERG